MNGEISERLKSERKHLGFASQGDLAEKMGVSPGSVHNYEAGKRSPDAVYLAKLAELGADVGYILTGQRNMGGLAPDEAALLDNYRNAPPARRATLQEVGAAFAEQDGLITKKSGG